MFVSDVFQTNRISVTYVICIVVFPKYSKNANPYVVENHDANEINVEKLHSNLYIMILFIGAVNC